MLFLAEQKYLLISPKKVRPVANMAKKLSPAKALETLPFVGSKAAIVLKKVVASAVANAKAKGASEETLVFKEIQIGEGPRLKRGMAGAHGRWKPIKKRMSHIRVVLETKEQLPVKKEESKQELPAEEPRKKERKGV